MSGLQPVLGCGVQGDVPLSAVLRLSRYLLLLAGFISGSCLLCTAAAAQDVGISVPRPLPVPVAGYEISRLEVSAVVRQQSAKVRVSSVLKNPGLQAIEASFLFPLPDDAVVGSLTLLVEGKELTGAVLEAKEARRIYEATVRRQRDPALLEYVGRRLLRSSVFPIPAGAERTVEFEYVVLPVPRGSLRELRLPLRSVRAAQSLGVTAAAPLNVQQLEVNVTIHSEQPLSTLYSPSHADVTISGGAEQKTVSLKQSSPGVPGDFVLMFSSGVQDGVPAVLSYRRNAAEPGYFMVLAAPADQQVRPVPGGRSIVLVVDRSGSMRGEKFLQAQQGIRRLLESLNADDHFDLVVYDSDVELFRNELQMATPENIQLALQWADALKPQGGTNISEGLAAALRLTSKGERPAWVLFLTDGLPTAGVTDEKQIAALASRDNVGQARIFSLGVGYDVNSRLLDRLSAAHRGRTAYVPPGEQIDAAVAAIEAGIASPLLTDLQLRLIDAGGKEPDGITQIWPKKPTDLYRGEVFVYTGRYRDAGDVQVQLTGNRDGVPVTLTGNGQLTAQSSDSALSFVERLWAGRRIAELTAQMDQNGESEELLTELLELSKKHGILTPWTSFLADERQSLDAVTALPALRGAVREQAKRVSGAAAVHSRSSLQRLAASAGALPAEKSEADNADLNALFGDNAVARPALGSAGMWSGSGGLFPVPGRASAVASTDAAGKAKPTLRGPRVVGNRAFFWKEGCWMEVDLQPADRNSAQRVVLFSDQYFALSEQEADAGQCLAAFGEQPVLIRLGQVVYLIESAGGAPGR
ncbi:MAG: VIT and vWA domain-containing protein [Planctomyces sp.]